MASISHAFLYSPYNIFNFSLHRCSCWGLKNVTVVITGSNCEIYEWYFLCNWHSAAMWAASVSIAWCKKSTSCSSVCYNYSRVVALPVHNWGIALITHLEEVTVGSLNEFELNSNSWADQRIHSLERSLNTWDHHAKCTAEGGVKWHNKVNLVAIKAALDNCPYMAMY